MNGFIYMAHSFVFGDVINPPGEMDRALLWKVPVFIAVLAVLWAACHFILKSVKEENNDQ